MKSFLLPFAAVAATVTTLGLTAVTLAGPAEAVEAPAAAQARQMEQQSRMREWSQGLGVDLSNGGTMLAQAGSEPPATAQSKPTPRVPTSSRVTKDRDAHGGHHERDQTGVGEHKDDDEDESHS